MLCAKSIVILNWKTSVAIRDGETIEYHCKVGSCSKLGRLLKQGMRISDNYDVPGRADILVLTAPYPTAWMERFSRRINDGLQLR